MKLSDISTRVRILLNDQDETRWTPTEITSWTNDAQKLVALMRPDASVSNSVVTLVAGTKQSVPADGFRLLDVIRNMGSDGTTAGRSVRIVDREVLDSQDPMWHTTTPAATVKHFIYDNRNPLTFYVYPPAQAGVKLEVMYSKSPTEVTNPNDVLPISDLYLDTIVNYVMYRAYSKDAEFSSNAQLASGYLQVVYSMLGIKTQKDVAFSPDMNSKGAMPNAAAIQAGGV